MSGPFYIENCVMRRVIMRLDCIHVQVNLIITLSLGSMETDRVISEPCYNEVIYNRHNN